MQRLGKLIIKSKKKIIQFLNDENTGRISSIDEGGYPFSSILEIRPVCSSFKNSIILFLDLMTNFPNSCI